MTNYCDKCKVYVDGTHSNCPLCGAFIKKDEIIVIDDESQPKQVISLSFPKVTKEFIIKDFIFKLFVFVSLIGIGAVFIIDFLSSRHIDWSLHVLVGVALFWFTVGRALFSRARLGRQMFWDCIFICMLMYYVRYCIGNPNHIDWPNLYAVPGVIIAYILTMCLIMVMKYTKWTEYCLSTLLLCIISTIPLIIGFVMNGSAHFMTYICVCVGVTVIICMLIFGSGGLVKEVKKKFHI